MKYKTVIISKSLLTGEWDCSIRIDDKDRVEREMEPNPWGFMHYPESMPDKTARDKLLDCLIGNMKESVYHYNEQIEELTNLKNSTNPKPPLYYKKR
jgi:hypothetical protein